MLLAIDIGNSNIVFGVHDRNEWVAHWRIHTVIEKTSDEYEVLLRGLFQRDGIVLEKVTGVVISSVVPYIVPRIRVLIKKLLQQDPLVIGPEVYHQLPVQVLNPTEIGSDLVCNAVAAFQSFPGSCIIVDFGTALTFTTILSSGKIAGVAIAPGLKTAVGSLTEKTALLPSIELSPPPSPLGKNTVEAIQSGVVFGYVGLIESLLLRTESEIRDTVTVIATGGLSGVMRPLIKRIDHLAPHLTLDGLKLIADQVA
ncbi:MAG: type III pantothenate kinase [Cyclobacteriaceae bacterium]